MTLLPWDRLPDFLRTESGRECYDILQGRQAGLAVKRGADILFSGVLLVLLAPVMGVTAGLVAASGPGGILFRQTRIGRYGQPFTILKFRTMNTHPSGSAITCREDRRITPIGHLLRRLRMDEMPQLLNILRGEMSFVGPRPEIPEYVAHYTPQMAATLLMPVGLTGSASLRFKDEAQLLAGEDPEGIYLERILPEKMACNWEYLHHFSLWGDFCILVRTALCAVGL